MVIKRSRLWTPVVVLISTTVTMPAGAQTSEHQRIGVERLTDWELGSELGSGMTREAYDSIDYLFVESHASIDALVAKSWTASLYVPLSSEFSIGGDDSTASIAGSYEYDDGGVRSLVVTATIENTGASAISRSTLTITATTGARTYWKTVSSETRVLPGAKIKVTSAVAYADAAETLLAGQLSIGDAFFE